MLLEGSPKVHLILNNGDWFVWLSMPLTMLERRLHGLEPTPISTAIRDPGDTSKLSQREIKLHATSSVIVFHDTDEAEIFADSLAQKLEADVDRSLNVDIPEHDSFEP